MKFDIARAWKDESYRQTLSEEQLEMLPANPVGELSEAEMQAVSGGNGYFDGYGDFGIGASSASANLDKRVHSFALICDLSLFSVNLIQVPVIPIVSGTHQVCAESH